jgi:hypothetical protein
MLSHLANEKPRQPPAGPFQSQFFAQSGNFIPLLENPCLSLPRVLLESSHLPASCLPVLPFFLSFLPFVHSFSLASLAK